MFFTKKVKTLILISSFTIALMIVTIVHYDRELSKAKKEIEILNDSEKLKGNEILKLESELETVFEKLIESEDLIFNLNDNLKNIQGKVKNKEDEIIKLKKELNKYEGLRQLDVVATAYDAFCNTGCIGITKTGYDVSDTVFKNGKRVIAVDPNLIPLGSLVYVETKGGMSFIGTSIDTGGAIKGNRIDILMENRGKAFKFGVQNAKVTVLSEGGSI